MLCILIDFLQNCQQRVVLNGQFLSCSKVNAGIPQGSILGHLHFGEDTSLFSIVQDITTSTASLNNDLTKIIE